MTTAFPGALDTFNNPSSTNNMNDTLVPHDLQHTNINDAMAAVQAALGITGSVLSTSVQYKLAQKQSVVIFAGAPATSTSTGIQGTIIVSGGFVYFCIATNSWVRSTVASW